MQNVSSFIKQREGTVDKHQDNQKVSVIQVRFSNNSPRFKIYKRLRNKMLCSNLKILFLKRRVWRFRQAYFLNRLRRLEMQRMSYKFALLFKQYLKVCFQIKEYYLYQHLLVNRLNLQNRFDIVCVKTKFCRTIGIARQWIKRGFFLVNGEVIKLPGFFLKEHDFVQFNFLNSFIFASNFTRRYFRQLRSNGFRNLFVRLRFPAVQLKNINQYLMNNNFKIFLLGQVSNILVLQYFILFLKKVSLKALYKLIYYQRVGNNLKILNYLQVLNCWLYYRKNSKVCMQFYQQFSYILSLRQVQVSFFLILKNWLGAFTRVRKIILQANLKYSLSWLCRWFAFGLFTGEFGILQRDKLVGFRFGFLLMGKRFNSKFAMKFKARGVFRAFKDSWRSYKLTKRGFVVDKMIPYQQKFLRSFEIFAKIERLCLIAPRMKLYFVKSRRFRRLQLKHKRRQLFILRKNKKFRFIAFFKHRYHRAQRKYSIRKYSRKTTFIKKQKQMFKNKCVFGKYFTKRFSFIGFKRSEILPLTNFGGITASGSMSIVQRSTFISTVSKFSRPRTFVLQKLYRNIYDSNAYFDYTEHMVNSNLNTRAYIGMQKLLKVSMVIFINSISRTFLSSRLFYDILFCGLAWYYFNSLLKFKNSPYTTYAKKLLCCLYKQIFAVGKLSSKFCFGARLLNILYTWDFALSYLDVGVVKKVTALQLAQRANSKIFFKECFRGAYQLGNTTYPTIYKRLLLSDVSDIYYFKYTLRLRMRKNLILQDLLFKRVGVFVKFFVQKNRFNIRRQKYLLQRNKKIKSLITRQYLDYTAEVDLDQLCFIYLGSSSVLVYKWLLSRNYYTMFLLRANIKRKLKY